MHECMFIVYPNILATKLRLLNMTEGFEVPKKRKNTPSPEAFSTSGAFPLTGSDHLMIYVVRPHTEKYKANIKGSMCMFLQVIPATWLKIRLRCAARAARLP